MTDFHVASATRLEDGAVVWLTDRHGCHTSFLGSDAVPLERWHEAAPVQTQLLASPGTLPGHLTQNRQA